MLRPVRHLTAALLGLSVALSGCGGGPSDSEQVHDVVEAFGAATKAKDYQRLCDDLLAPKLVDEVERVGLPCEVALRQGLGEVRSPELTIGRIEVKGDRATADVRIVRGRASRPRATCWSSSASATPGGLRL